MSAADFRYSWRKILRQITESWMNTSGLHVDYAPLKVIRQKSRKSQLLTAVILAIMLAVTWTVVVS